MVMLLPMFNFIKTPYYHFLSANSQSCTVYTVDAVRVVPESAMLASGFIRILHVCSTFMSSLHVYVYISPEQETKISEHVGVP